jgi:hypothetical protein
MNKKNCGQEHIHRGGFELRFAVDLNTRATELSHTLPVFTLLQSKLAKCLKFLLNSVRLLMLVQAFKSRCLEVTLSDLCLKQKKKKTEKWVS